MTKAQKMIELLRENPCMTNQELSVELKASSDSIRTMLSRLNKQGRISSSTEGDIRTVEVLVDPPKGFRKQAIYNSMLDTYMDDFYNASNFDERTRVGSLILRILEKV